MVTKFLNIDTDSSLTANSNERVPSQKAIKTYTDAIDTAKQNKTLTTPITVETTEETTVEGALGSINTSLSTKQDQTLSSSITVAGTPQTTVEGALSAINTVAGNAVQPSDLATVATTGSYNDLLDKPTIPAGQVQSNWDESDESDVSYIQNKPILGTMATENAADYTKTVNLANVALSGDYDDLTNKPTIPAAQVQSDWDESDESDVAYIKNKPYIPSEVIVDQTYDSTSTHAQSGTAVAQAISTKQDTLTAGNNITISSNVISAKDTTYTAGTGISITEDSDENLVISNTQTSAQWGNITGTLSNQTDLQTALSDKQDTLVSGTNIKTVNNNSLLGSGNLDIDALPTQTGQSGKFLTTDGTDASWSDKPLVNSANQNTSLAIVGTTGTNTSYSLSVGVGAEANYGSFCTAIGANAKASIVGGSEGIAIGYNAISSATGAIQLGTGTNSSTNTFKVTNYELMSADGTIPVARLNTMTGADGTNAGSKGAVPAPAATDNTKFLKGDGTWANVDALPSQTGQSGKFLTTDGSSASWASPVAVIIREW